MILCRFADQTAVQLPEERRLMGMYEKKKKKSPSNLLLNETPRGQRTELFFFIACSGSLTPARFSPLRRRPLRVAVFFFRHRERGRPPSVRNSPAAASPGVTNSCGEQLPNHSRLISEGILLSDSNPFILLLRRKAVPLCRGLPIPPWLIKASQRKGGVSPMPCHD